MKKGEEFRSSQWAMRKDACAESGLLTYESELLVARIVVTEKGFVAADKVLCVIYTGDT